MKEMKKNPVNSYKIVLNLIKKNIETTAIYNLADHISLNLPLPKIQPFKGCNIFSAKAEKINVTKCFLNNVQDVFFNQYTDNFINFFKNDIVTIDYNPYHQDDTISLLPNENENENEKGQNFDFPEEELDVNNFKIEIQRKNRNKEKNVFFDTTDMKHKKHKKIAIAVDLTHCKLSISLINHVNNLPDFCTACAYNAKNECSSCLMHINVKKYENYEKIYQIFSNFFYNEHIEKLIERFNTADYRKKLERESKKTISESESKIRSKDSCILDVVHMPIEYSFSDYFDFFDYDYINY